MPKVTELAIKRRIALVLLVAVAFLFILALRLVQVQVFQNPRLKEYAFNQRLRPMPVDAKRGTIYDRNMNELAVSVSADAAYAVPADIENPEETARQVAQILDLDYDFVYQRLTKHTASVWLKKRISEEESKALWELDLPGIGIVENPQRFYPNKELAAQVLGIAGIDNQGLEGLEFYYDSYLRGLPGRVVAERDAAGREIPGGIRKYIPPVDGKDIVLTIDQVIQYIAERELAKAVRETNSSKGIVVIMRPSTGEVLAMANWPSFDPNAYQDYPAANRRNYAVTDLYEPGSTFKIITSAVALEEGVTDLERRFYDPGYIVIGKHRIRCWKAGGHGSQSFVEAVENSCNPVFATLGMEIGEEVFYKYIKAFGFGAKTGIDFPGEAVGQVHKPGTIAQVGWANIGFGQGISVSPLQLVTAVSAVANGGVLVQPRLVSKIIGPDGEKVISPEVRRRVISEETSHKMRRILRSVVVNGSGRRADIPGYRVAGKTGTAQIAVGGGYSRSKVVSSFIGFAPFDDPELVCLVALYEPQTAITYGGVLAAPVFQAIVKDVLEYLNVEPYFDQEQALKFTGLARVPNIRNYPVSEAIDILTKAGFKVTVSGEGPIVVDQVPKPVATVQKGTTVILETSLENSEDNMPLGSEENGESLVPNVFGLTIREAAAVLEREGFLLVPKGSGLAVSQSPKAGSVAPRGAKVEVTFADN
ncbi:MAG: PASTA domain-containing protein [Firmicutes bacterium]|nr:PASTA domain-containing protein [Bacillota bacterium]